MVSLYKMEKDLKTQYKEGLITLEKYKEKIREIGLKMKKDFNKTGFKSVAYDGVKIK